MPAPQTSLEHLPDCAHGCGQRLARLNFTFPASVEQIAPIVAAVVGLALEEFGPEEAKHQEVGLALQEALANAVVHGSRCNPRLMVRCWVACDRGQGMIIAIRDEGNGYDPDKLPHPKDADRLEMDHGRGIYLIRSLMSDVHFTRNGSEIHMKKV